MEQPNPANSASDSSPFDPSAPAVPISYPLKTLAELESRAYFNSFHFPFNQASAQLRAEAGMPRRPRTLVCHDMQGGYTDDRFVQGGTNAEAYAIWHWYLIDVFVYFSHNLVTLPPPCWTNAAHRNGVKVLGTLIMEEGDDIGEQPIDKLLSTETTAHMYADRLTELAVALGFDGWLINMEVEVDPEKIPVLEEFVSYLTKTMHSSLPGSLVIWYDSITVDGSLIWQNQLNTANKPFFDRCDGIFVNYFWLDDYLKLSADVAGDRKYDVYMGVDVFGRGTYGGGQWKTHVALDVIKKNDLSAAIFAPGWVYETKQPPDFQTAQNQWWGLVEKSWGTVQKHPKVLPFYSNFDQGHGYHISVDGKQVYNTPWNNISSQSIQPFIEYTDSSTQPIQVSIGFKEASYSGGGNITFKGTLKNDPEFTARLFQGELLLGDFPVHFTYSVKSSGNSLLGLALESSNAANERRFIFLAAPGSAGLTTNQFHNQFSQVVMPYRVTKLEGDHEWLVQESSIYMKGHILREMRAVCYTSKYHQEPRETVLGHDKNQSQGPPQYHAVLGDIKITKSQESTKFPPPSSWLIGGQFVSWAVGPSGSKLLSVKVTWQLKDGSADIFTKYNIYVSKLTRKSSGEMIEGARDYLGVAVLKTYYVSKLEVASGVSGLKFIIQACGPDGTCQTLEDSPFFLQVQGTKIMKEEHLQCKCGEEICENFESFGKLFNCCYIISNNLNAKVRHEGYWVPRAGAEVEGCKILRRYANDGSRVELYTVCLLLTLNLIILAVYMYWPIR